MSKTLKSLIISIVFIYSTICLSNEPINLKSIILKAENGDAYFQGVLGAIYRRGETGEINYKKAYKWLKLSSDQGNPIGMYNLAVLYEQGIGIPKDTTISLALYAKAFQPMHTLAETGNFRAQVNLGYILETGAGTKENLQKALHWYEKAAHKGFPRAQYIVGYKHYHGWGYDRDYNKAAEWFSKAAEQEYPAAQHILGNMYANGIGLSKNYGKAVILHRKSEKYQNNTEFVSEDSAYYILNGVKQEGDKVISGLLPPNFKYNIKEGSCGEACLWSLINSKEFITSQIEINHEGGGPGRGLHANELHRVLDKYDFEYVDTMNKSYFTYALSFINPANLFSSDIEKYKDFVYDVIIEKIRKGIPIILGIKINPDKHFFWDIDHFILLVGYNEKTNELIFNNFNKRDRIRVDKLLNTTQGYSLINRYNFLNYIEIKNF